MKYESKKDETSCYTAKEKPALVTVPRWRFLTIRGTGNPNGADFSERVGVLYSLAFPIKMGFKAAYAKDPALRAGCAYEDYTVFPLEGVWSTSDPSDPLNKDKFVYTIMIRHPDFVPPELFEAAFAQTSKKKPHPLLDEVVFEEMEDGLCAQVLHKGSFDGEPASFAKMDRLCAQNGYARLNHIHREIYFSDPRRTAPENLRTILRYQVRPL